MKKSTISFKTDETTKGLASKTCRDLGIDLSTAMNIFLKRFVDEGGFPFLVKTGYSSSASVVETKTKKVYSSIDELLADMSVMGYTHTKHNRVGIGTGQLKLTEEFDREFDAMDEEIATMLEGDA